MPFQGHAFRALTPEEASPFGNIIQNMMRDYQNAVKSAYVKPSLAEELKKAQLARKKSALALSQAQMANKYLPGKLEAEAKAREFKLKHPYAYLPGEAGQLGALMAMAEDPALSQYFGGTGQPQNAPQVQPGTQPQAQPEDNAGDFTSRLSQLLGSEEPKSYVEMLPKAQPAMQPAMQPEIQKPTSPFQQILQSKINKMMDVTKPAMSNTAKEINELEDINAGFKPGTNRTEKLTPNQQEVMRKGLEAKISGLPKGHFFVRDNEGNVVGESRPKTQKEKDIDRGTVLFDTFYPVVNKGLNYYSAFNSMANFERDAANYKRDPEARKRFDDFLLAYKLRTVTGVNEAARFGAGKTNQTYNRFFETLTDLDVPKRLQKLVKEYQVINEANIKAGDRFHKMLTKAQRLYEKQAQPNVIEYYPGMAPNRNQMELEDPLGIR